MDRRALLTATGTTVSYLTAGCFDSNHQPTDALAAPAWISVWNNTGDPVEVDVTASKEGTDRYEETFSLEGATSQPDADIVDHDTRWIDESWLGAVTEYTVAAAIDDRDRSDSVSTADLIDDRYDELDADGMCYYFLVRVGPTAPRESATADDLTATIRGISSEQDVPDHVQCK